MAPSQLGIFTKSSPDFDRANIQFHVQPLSLDRFGIRCIACPAIHGFGLQSPAHVARHRPPSLGWTLWRSRLSHRTIFRPTKNRRVAADAIRATRRLMKQEALRRFRPEEFIPGPSIDDSEAALARAAGDIGTTIFHPVGTAKMGMEHESIDGCGSAPARDRAGWATRHRCVGNADHHFGNTNTPTIMIADKGAQYVLSDAP